MINSIHSNKALSFGSLIVEDPSPNKDFIDFLQELRNRFTVIEGDYYCRYSQTPPKDTVIISKTPYIYGVDIEQTISYIFNAPPNIENIIKQVLNRLKIPVSEIPTTKTPAELAFDQAINKVTPQEP
jgi:hypothetical protein